MKVLKNQKLLADIINRVPIGFTFGRSDLKKALVAHRDYVPGGGHNIGNAVQKAIKLGLLELIARGRGGRRSRYERVRGNEEV